jgi:hypothetical protein
LIALGLFVVANIGYAEKASTYLCIPDFGTGFSYTPEKKAWEVTRFRTKDRKYILSKSSGEWIWKDFGSDSGYPCSEFDKSGVIACGFGGVADVAFSRNTMRFRDSYLSGYVDGIDNSHNTPSVTIGTCTKL